MKKINLSEGSIIKNLISLSWPMMLAFMLQTSFNIVDAIFVGRISAMALAAVSLTFPVVFLMISLAAGAGVGTTSLIARLLGANKQEEANNAAEHAYLIAFFLSIIFMIIGFIFGKPLFRFIGATEEMLPMVLDYTNIIFAGSIVMFAAFISNSILRGEGDMKTPMKVMMISTVINIILDPIMIFGWGFIPAMGIKGAAIATVIARTVGAIIAIRYILMGNSTLKLNIKKFAFKFRIIKDILKVGLPASLSQSTMALGIFFMTKIVSSFGPFAIAAYGLGFRLDSVAVMPAIGLSTAVITIVGFNIGAKKPERAKKTTWIGALLSFAFMGIIGLTFFLFPEQLIRLFNNNPEVIAFGISYLRIVALSYGFIGFSMIIGSAFQGAGKGYPALILTILRLFAISIPLAIILSNKIGVSGIWWGIFVSTVITGIISIIWLKYAHWKKIEHPKEKPLPELINS